MSLCGCVCARPDFGSEQMKRERSLLVCNLSPAPPPPAQTHMFTPKTHSEPDRLGVTPGALTEGEMSAL